MGKKTSEKEGKLDSRKLETLTDATVVFSGSWKRLPISDLLLPPPCAHLHLELIA